MATLTTVTPATGAALRKLFTLLEEKFDVASGQYAQDYSDERIAKETGISTEAVKSYRSSAFGKLRPPSELSKAVQDLADLESLFLKTEADMRDKIKQLQHQVRQLQKRFD